MRRWSRCFARCGEALLRRVLCAAAARMGGLLLAGGLLMGPTGAAAQPTGAGPDTTRAWHDEAWTPIVHRAGLRIDYIYYPEADAEHDGIVLRLVSDTSTPVRYAFTVVFRAPAAETTATVQGRLEAGEMKTGDAAGLFWIPFEGQNHTLAEIGIRGLEVWPARPSRQSQ